MRIQKIAGLIALLLLIAGVIGLAVHRAQPISPANANDGKLHVVATYYPLYEFAKQIGGTTVDVTNVTPAGAEPHDYEPSPQTLASIQQADAFIYNGGTLEPWVPNVLTDYKHQAIKASTGIALHTGSSEDGAPAHGVQDPHFWLDPVLAQKIVATIRDGFIAADPTHAGRYTANAAAYTEQLRQLDRDFRTGLQTCSRRTIVTSHAAFGYIAQRYDLTVVSIAGISPDQEPSAAKLAEISDAVRREHIPVIFFEQLVSPRLADTIAHETGAKTAVFDPIEGLDDNAQKAGKNYLTVQRDNLGALRAALACR